MTTDETVLIMTILVIVIISHSFKDVAPLIDSTFFPGDIWRTEFIDKGFCNGLTEEKLCYYVGKFFVGDDPTNVNYVSKY